MGCSYPVSLTWLSSPVTLSNPCERCDIAPIYSYVFLTGEVCAFIGRAGYWGAGLGAPMSGRPSVTAPACRGARPGKRPIVSGLISTWRLGPGGCVLQVHLQHLRREWAVGGPCTGASAASAAPCTRRVDKMETEAGGQASWVRWRRWNRGQNAVLLRPQEPRAQAGTWLATVEVHPPAPGR